MQILNPTLVGSIASQSSTENDPVPASLHEHKNLDVLKLLTVESNVLMFNGDPVDTVGQQFLNAAILEKFSVVDGKLFFDGTPVDTAGSVFNNEAVLRLLSQDNAGNLLFNGQPIEGANLPNADDLKRLAVDSNGQLTVDGVVVSGSGGNVTLTVTKLGSGTALLKSATGTDLQTRSLVAGSNITLDVSSDEVKINASLSGATSSTSTFKLSDGYTDTNTRSDTTSTLLASTELTTATNELLLLRLGSDLKSTQTSTAPSSSGNVTVSSTCLLRNRIATLFNNGYFDLGVGATYTSGATLASAFAGTAAFSVVVDFQRTSTQSTNQVIFSSWNGTASATSFGLGISSSNTPYAWLFSGTTQTTITSSVAVTDLNKHTLEVTRSGSNFYMFLDGVLVASNTAYSSSVNTATGGFRVGNDLTGTAPFYGYLRDLRVWTAAQHTAAYTVTGYYSDKIGTINTVDMDGKLLSSVFWKTISSLSVTSTETASAYLLWMLRTGDGNVRYWDASNKVWTVDSAANILTKGVKTATLQTAMTNFSWNYLSDTFGFLVALVTTDGTTTPILTSITVNAIQSADKTAGHAIVDGSGNTSAQRTQLQFKNAVVSDDGVHTVVTVPKDSADLTHSGSTLASVVSDLVSYRGTIGGKATYFSSGLSDGSILVYDQLHDTFKSAVQAKGAAGNGLYVTDPFTLDAGEEKTVSHQLIAGGKVQYEAEQILSGSDLVVGSKLSKIADVVATTLSVPPYYFQSALSLPRTTSTPVKSNGTAFPTIHAWGITYRVGEYIYLVPAYAVTYVTASTAIYRAHVSAPMTWTLLSDTFPQSLATVATGRGVTQSCVAQYEGYTYIVSAVGIFRSSFDTPSVWSLVSSVAITGAATVHVLNGYMYLFGSSADAKIYRSAVTDLNTWTAVGTMPEATSSSNFWVCDGYLFKAGGGYATANTYSNKVYRASISDPTTWTQIGTLPLTTGFAGQCLIGSKILIAGGRTDANAGFRNTVYMSDAGNPVSWSTLTTLTTAELSPAAYVVGNKGYITGGYKSGGYTSETNVYSLSQSASSTSGVVEFQDQNVSVLETLKSASVTAMLDAGYYIRYALCLDGTWYASPSSGSWQAYATRDLALAASQAAVSGTGLQMVLSGLSDVDVSAYSTARLGLKLETTDATAYGEVLGVSLTYLTSDTASPLLITGYTSNQGDLGLMHLRSNYQTTNVKNKTSSTMSVVLKVLDGLL